jgi:hypothetical protein
MEESRLNIISKKSITKLRTIKGNCLRKLLKLTFGNTQRIVGSTMKQPVRLREVTNSTLNIILRKDLQKLTTLSNTDLAKDSPTKSKELLTKLLM